MIETYPGQVSAVVAFLPQCVLGCTRGKVKLVTAMLKAIHAQEDKVAALDKLEDVLTN